MTGGASELFVSHRKLIYKKLVLAGHKGKELSVLEAHPSVPLHKKRAIWNILSVLNNL